MSLGQYAIDVGNEAPAYRGGSNDLSWSVPSVLAVLATLIPKVVPSYAGRITKLDAYLQIAPTLADVTLAFKKNGSLIGTVTISAGALSGTTTLGSPVAFAAGDVLTCEPTQVGAGVAGAVLSAYARLG